jgi:hypothetical protein
MQAEDHKDVEKALELDLDFPTLVVIKKDT